MPVEQKGAETSAAHLSVLFPWCRLHQGRGQIVAGSTDIRNHTSSRKREKRKKLCLGHPLIDLMRIWRGIPGPQYGQSRDRWMNGWMEV